VVLIKGEFLFLNNNYINIGKRVEVVYS